MKLTIKVENQKVYDSLIQLFQSIGVTIIENAKTFSKTNSTIKKNPSDSNSPVYGRLKGKIKTSVDFNEPLDEFRDYV